MSKAHPARLAYCAILNSLLFYGPLCFAVANPGGASGPIVHSEPRLSCLETTFRLVMNA